MKNKLLSLLLLSFMGMSVVAGDDGLPGQQEAQDFLGEGLQPLREGSIIFTAGPMTHAIVDVSDVFTENHLRNKLADLEDFAIPYENYVFMTRNAGGEDVEVALEDWDNLHISENNVVGFPHVWIAEVAAPVPPEAVDAPDLEGEDDPDYLPG